MIRSLVMASAMVIGATHTTVVGATDNQPEFLRERPSNVPTVYVPIEGETHLFLHCLKHVDTNAGYIEFDDGTKWQSDVSDESARAELERWMKGDWIGIHPPKVFSHGRFQLENRSRGNGELVAVSLVHPPLAEDPWLSKPVDWVETRGMHGLDYLHLQDGSVWAVESSYRKVLERWNPGDPTICDVVEEYRYCLGNLVIRERVLIINAHQLTHVIADPAHLHPGGGDIPL